MQMQKPNLRASVILMIIFLTAGILLIRLYRVSTNETAVLASTKQGHYLLNVPLAQGAIYDRNFSRLTQPKHVWYALVNQTPDIIMAVRSKALDKAAFDIAVKQRKPFCCMVTDSALDNPNIQVFEGYQTDHSKQLAQHLIGYRQNGKGVCGLQAACSEILSANDSNITASFSVDAYGAVLAGLHTNADLSGNIHGGIVTTLDKSIQQITELALTNADPNPAAAIVLNVHTGEILALASRPLYDEAHLSEAMDNENAPFLNRALCAYSVGSVFKLVTAAAALESGFTSGYMYCCSGSTEIYGQRFRCHNMAGHGLLDMENAMVNSCNPYFINLSQILTADAFHQTAEQLGFGIPISLADGFSSSAGYLQSVQELHVEAEKANLAFGQGKLLATPLHIAAMTACIANDGVYHMPWLLRGETTDGVTLQPYAESEPCRVLCTDSAQTLQKLMCAVLSKGEGQNGVPNYTTAGGKTSTAQTGQYAADGTEYCHAWMTGFFPSEQPKYAVTVFVERGGSGNQAAAPIFRDIIDHIAQLN